MGPRSDPHPVGVKSPAPDESGENHPIVMMAATQGAPSVHRMSADQSRDGDSPNLGPVVITGTSTGIGAASALHLATQGFRVFAGVRSADEGEALAARASGGLTPVILEITDSESITAAVESVKRAVGAHGLAGLVNNAGIVVPAPLELQPLDDFRRQLEVNLIGQLAVTQAFLPLIRRGGGRIVNVGSIGGRIVLPLHGAYSASKFGMEAVSDALRLELKQWHIPVALIDPGATRSAIFGKTLKALDGLDEKLGEHGLDLYGPQRDAIRKVVEQTAEDAVDPEVLARAVAHALTVHRPRSRYLAGKGAKATGVIARTLPDRLKDLAVARQVHLPKA